MANQSKEKLDELLKTYKAQPVGSGYIDIIVLREHYRSFAKALIENGYLIKAISWWEYLVSDKQPNGYGMGGPRSKFYSGRFAEINTALDELPASEDLLPIIVKLAESKVLGEQDGQYVSTKKSNSLTPAFWLKVDEKWKNKQFVNAN